MAKSVIGIAPGISMNRTHVRKMISAAAALTALSLTGAAFAQYVWIDEKGVKQYSDMAPPASVPASRIIKQPHGSTISPATVTAAESAAPDKAEMTTAEKNAEFRKRRAEQAEKEKKAAEDTRFAAEKAKHCEQAREYSRALESGERLTRTDKNGERIFLPDEQRSREIRETRRVLQDCK